MHAALRAVSGQRPLVHCLTNVVAAGFTANVLLAVGASPAMVENVAEAAEFATLSSAVLVNLGTLSPDRERAMLEAAAAADRHGRPWILDPVAVGVLAHRTAFAVRILEWHPAVIRGNASEVMGLSGAGGVGRGVDSLIDSHRALDAASTLAREERCVVAVSGAVDYVTDGADVIAVPGGSPSLTRVTGTGCALGALIAAFAAVEEDPLFAAAAASAVFSAAGERAARGQPGPGTFAIALLDALDALVKSAGTSSP